MNRVNAARRRRQSVQNGFRSSFEPHKKLSPSCVVGHITLSQNIMSFQLPAALAVKSIPTCGLCMFVYAQMAHSSCIYFSFEDACPCGAVSEAAATLSCVPPTVKERVSMCLSEQWAVQTDQTYKEATVLLCPEPSECSAT